MTAASVHTAARCDSTKRSAISVDVSAFKSAGVSLPCQCESCRDAPATMPSHDTAASAPVHVPGTKTKRRASFAAPAAPTRCGDI